MTAHPEPGIIPPLFTGLVDDAAIFPPGNMPLPKAVEAHRRHRVAWYADLVGPLLVGSGKLADLAELADPERPLRVAVVVAGGAAGVGPAVRAVLAAPGLILAGVETAGDTAKILAAYHEYLPEGISGAVEVVFDERIEANLDLIAATGHRAKFRTGGVTAEAFPSTDELARFLAFCTDRGLPFKLTAGLHNALHHTDPETGFRHYGFLNVLTATAAAVDAGPPLSDTGRAFDDVSGRLTSEGPTVADETGRIVAGGLPEPRGLFTGFGSCSIDEPLDDLVALRLLARPADPADPYLNASTAPYRPKEQHP